MHENADRGCETCQGRSNKVGAVLAGIDEKASFDSYCGDNTWNGLHVTCRSLGGYSPGSTFLTLERGDAVNKLKSHRDERL